MFLKHIFFKFNQCSPLMKIVFFLFFIGGNAVLWAVKFVSNFAVFWYVLGYNVLVFTLFVLMIKWSKKF